MRRWKWLAVSFAALLLALASVPAFAQRLDGDLRGEVKDPSGALVVAAKISVTNQNTGLSRKVETTEVGTFTVANLLPGLYTVTVEMSGFKKHVRKNVEVLANRVVEVNVALELGEATTSVTVESGAEIIETQGATLAGGTFGEKQLYGALVQSGSITGDVRNLAIIAPGTTTQPGGMAGQGGAIGGNRPRNNSFTVDGLDNNDPSVTGQNAPVINEAVKEFTLLTNQFAAEYGHSTAGQFIITSMSGTNEIHGKGWWYNQNRNFNALDNLTRAVTAPGADKPRFDLNRLGGQVGGPVIKNKLFYFGSYELQNLGLAGTSPNTITVPTAAGLATLQSLATTAGSGISPVNVGILGTHVPTAATQTGTIAVCNEVVDPTCTVAASAVQIPVGTFSATTPQFLKTNLFQISSDYETGRHKLSGRYHYSRQRSIAAGTLPVAEFNSDTVLDTQRVTLSHVFTVNSKMVNEFRVGYVRRRGPDQTVQNTTPPGTTDVFGNYAIAEMSLNIGPQTNFPQGQAGNTYQYAENLTYVRGSHTFKLGADLRVLLRGGGFLPRARGEYQWANDPTGSTTGARNLSGLDGFVRDTFPTAVSIRGVGSGFYSQNRDAVYFFAQDSWKIHRRLTVDYGIRYEFTQPARDQRLQDLNGLANLANIQGDPIFATLPARHQQELLSFVGNSVIFRRPKSDLNNWAPRLGLAWDVFGDGKTSLRAGASRGFDVLFGNLALLQLPPQVQAENRETNACVLAPSPTWCALAVGGNPRANTSDIRFATTGFIAGGALLDVLPLTTSVNPAVARAATGNFVRDDKMPEAWTWTLSVQREFWKNWLVEARYLGTRGLFLPTQRWLNAGIPVYFEGMQLPVFASQADVPASFAASALTRAQFLAAATPTILSPFGFNGVLTQFTPDGTSSYHGGSLKVERRFVNGLLINSSYTWSRTIDSGDNELNTSALNPRRPFNHNDVGFNKGLSAIHRGQKFAFTWVYEMPQYKGENGLLRGFARGWQWSGSYLAESGQPVTVQARRDIDGNGDTAGDWAFHNPQGTRGVGADSRTVCWNGAAVSFGCNVDAQVVGYVSLVDNAEWIRPGIGGQANGGRGTVISAGINTWNMDITKRTPFWGEGRVIEFSAQFLNVFNHPSFTIGTGGVLGLTTPALTNTGYVTPGNPSFLRNRTFSGGLGLAPFQRTIQWSLKLIF